MIPNMLYIEKKKIFPYTDFLVGKSFFGFDSKNTKNALFFKNFLGKVLDNTSDYTLKKFERV